MGFGKATVTIDDQSDPGSWAEAINEAPAINIGEILQERGSRYGTFSEIALISQNIKSAMSHSRNWDKLPADMRECLEMLASKIARMLNGDWTYTDNIVDAIGYLQLVLDRLERGQSGGAKVLNNDHLKTGKTLDAAR